MSVLSTVSVLQPAPHPGLDPVDLRYAYYYESNGKHKLAIYLPLAVQDKYIELIEIRDSVNDWRFTSPAKSGCKMSLATDGSNRNSRIDDVDSVKFIYGHHSFEGDIPIKISVSVYDEYTSNEFYRGVNKVLEELGEELTVDNPRVRVHSDILGLDDEDNEDAVEVTPEAILSSYVKAVESKAESEAVVDEEAVAYKLTLRNIYATRSILDAAQDYMLYEHTMMDPETYKSSVFSALLEDLVKVEWRSFLEPVNPNHPSWKFIKHRPVMHTGQCYYVISDLDIARQHFFVLNHMSDEECMKAVFIGRTGKVLVLGTYNEYREEVIEFNVRFYENKQRYRVFYPYVNMSNKNSGYFAKYDEMKPLNIYCQQPFEYHYSNKCVSSLPDTRWTGRVVIMEGEINSELCSMLRPDTLVISLGTSSLSEVNLHKIYNNISTTSTIEVALDDEAKSDVVANQLKYGQFSYIAYTASVPEEYQKLGMDFEDAAISLIMQYPEVVESYLGKFMDIQEYLSCVPEFSKFTDIGGTERRLDIRSTLLPNLPPTEARSISDILVSSLLEDRYLDDIEDTRIYELTHEIFDTTKSTLVSNEERRLDEAAEMLADGDMSIESESYQNESTKPTILRYVSSDEYEGSMKLTRMYQEDAPRFKSDVYGIEILGLEVYKSLKEKESEWYRLSQNQLKRLTMKVSTTLGYNPSQQLIRELGFDLDAKPTVINSKPRHVALALGASGGKSVGLRAAVCEYYEQICNHVSSANYQQIRELLKERILSCPDNIRNVLLGVMELKYSQLDVSDTMREFFSLYYKLNEVTQNKISTVMADIKYAISNRISVTSIKCASTPLMALFNGEDFNDLKMMEFLKGLDNSYDTFSKLVSMYPGEAGQVYHQLYELTYSVCTSFPADYDKLVVAQDGKPYLYRPIAPMNVLYNAYYLSDKLLEIHKTDELIKYIENVKSVLDKICSLTLVIACPSQIEVDKYFCTLSTISGIDGSFLKRFHSDCYHGTGLSSDDTVLCTTPVAIVTHQRIDRPSRVTQFIKYDNTVVPRKLMIIDESINTRSKIYVPEYVMTLLNKKLGGALSQWCVTTEELQKLRKVCEERITSWIDDTVVLDTEDRHLYRALMQVYFPTRKLPRSPTEVDMQFNDMSDTEKYSLVDAVDCIVYGLACVYKYYLSPYLDTDSEEIYDSPITRVLTSLITDENEDDGEGPSDATDTADQRIELYNFLTSMEEYSRACENGQELPNPSLTARDGLIERWWYYLSADINSSTTLVLPNPMSRTFKDVSIVLLDATSYDTLTSIDALGISNELMHKLLAVNATDEDMSVITTQSVRLINEGIENNQITVRTADMLTEKLRKGETIKLGDFNAVHRRSGRDPWIDSEKLGQFIYNAGRLGYRNSSINMIDLEWTVLKIPGPPISLSSVRNLQLPIGKVSTNALKRVDIKGESVYVPRRMLSFDVLKTMNEALCGEYSHDFIKKIPSTSSKLRETIYDIAAINAIHVANEEMIKSWTGDRMLPSLMEDAHDVHPNFKDDGSISYLDWIKNYYELEDSEFSGLRATPIYEKYEKYTDTDGVSTENAKCVRGVIVEFKVGTVYIRKEYWWDKFFVYSRRKLAYSRLHADHLTRCWSSDERKLIITTTMTALSLDTLTELILEYLTLPSIVEESTLDDSLITTPRALNVFTWRNINHVYTGLLGRHTYEYFPPIKAVVDSLNEHSKDIINDLRSAGVDISNEILDMVNIKNKMRVDKLISDMTVDSDYNTLVRSEVKALPLLLYARVERKIMEEYERLVISDNPDEVLLARYRELRSDLDRYLMITHHNSTECKATSDYQHATGTMIVGLHKLPGDVVEDHRVDLGDNYFNDGQAVALMTQELYRCRLRKGTIHNPKSIDLITINCDSDVVSQRVLNSNRVRSFLDNKMHDELRRFINQIRSKLNGFIFLDDDGKKETRDRALLAVLMVLEPSILYHYHSKSTSALPVNVCNDELVRQMIEMTADYCRTINLNLVPVESSNVFVITGQRNTDIIKYSTEVLLSELTAPLRTYLSSGERIDDLIPCWTDLILRIPQLSLIK